MSNLRSFKRKLQKSPVTTAKVKDELKTRLINKSTNQFLFGYSPNTWDYSQSLLCQITKKKE